MSQSWKEGWVSTWGKYLARECWQQPPLVHSELAEYHSEGLLRSTELEFPPEWLKWSQGFWNALLLNWTWDVSGNENIHFSFLLYFNRKIRNFSNLSILLSHTDLNPVKVKMPVTQEFWQFFVLVRSTNFSRHLGHSKSSSVFKSVEYQTWD